MSPVAVVGCARNEAHELGALMVRQTLEELGWRVVYLGLDVPTEDFASQQRKHAAALVCVSVVPPTGSAEAVAMHRLLSQMADPATPYRLAFGGSSLCDAGRLLPPSRGVTDVRFFDRLEPFATWIARPV